jgi:uncharacterized membrane protein YfcA
VAEWVWPLGAAGLVAGVVMGAVGYGFSSITVPVGLLFFTNRVLNPGLVLIQVILNATVVWTNRRAIPAVWARVWPTAAGVTPGVAIGTLVIAAVNDAAVKAVTYLLLLPVVMAQAAGWRRPLRLGHTGGAVVGAGVGALYAVTTISGPPLAALLTNQGFTGPEFRAGLGLIRFVESTLTAVAYGAAGLFVASSLGPAIPLAVGAAVGLPVGARVIRDIPPQVFRRVAMGIDTLLVAFGLTRVVPQAWPVVWEVLR